ncbi:MAG TPA: hypothetical protein P5545_07055 [Bacteroidota bacterium]|nr:hypothetical protein [Candidatus Kapabacteria bacterium]HRS02291.1 hypothetical protein [Bacteroidota bacterium]
MKPQKLYDELSEIAMSLGYKIRKDTGNFKSNNCILKDEKIIILNKYVSIEGHNSTLAKAIYDANYEDIFLKPVIRDYIDQIAIIEKTQVSSSSQ